LVIGLSGESQYLARRKMPEQVQAEVEQIFANR